MEYTEASKALQKAKINLMAKPDSAFFCELAFSFKYEWDTEIYAGATNGKVISLNPETFLDFNTEERVFLILHEVMHSVYLHFERVLGRDKKRWNKAGDYVINLALVERGFKMPETGLLDYQYQGLTTEQVYDLLPEEDDPNFECDLIEGGESPEQLKEFAEEILVRANMRSQQEGDRPGTIPGDIQLFIENLLNPKISWQKILQQYRTKLSKTDYSFMRPRRKYFPDMILPGIRGYSLIDIAIAVDISGSVSDEEFRQFVGEIGAIFKTCKPEKITLIQFDTAIKSIDELENLRDLMNVKFTGRGGTDVKPVINWANEKKPQLLLVFTDGYFKINCEYKKDLMWLIHNNPKFASPFGRVAYYNI